MINGVKFQQAVRMLDNEYLEALSDERIRKPMAYALYRAWEYFDKNEAPREVKCPYDEEQT